MPSNEIEWILVFSSLGFVLASAVASALIIMSVIRNRTQGSISNILSKLAGLVILGLYAITGLYLLPLVFYVARRNVSSMFLNELAFAFVGILTLLLVLICFKNIEED